MNKESSQVKYLRRAVELAGDIPIPGLSAECTAYISTHPSNAYDTLALHVFARGLFAAGYSDNAAAVYYALLQVQRPTPSVCALLADRLLLSLTGIRVGLMCPAQNFIMG